MATLDQVLDQMQAADMPPLPPGHPKADGKIHRYGGREKKCWYILFDVPTRNGRRVLTGAFGRWQGADNGKIPIVSDWTGVEVDEQQRFQRSQAEYEKREREKRAARARFAGNRALQQWNAGRARLSEGETVPYLAKKRLQWENGLRIFSDGTLLVPMVRYDVDEKLDEDPAYTGPRRLAGLQKIKPDGFKLFNKGMDPVGAACRFGRKPKDGDLLLLGEGLATVLTAHQGLERAYTCYVAFVAGNLERIAKMLRAQYPKSPILFLADDDAYLEAQFNKKLRNEYAVHELYKVLDAERELKSEKYGLVRVHASLHENADGAQVLTGGITIGGQVRTVIMVNTGRAKARAAASSIGNAWVAHPRFAKRELGNAAALDPDTPRLTDFNDLHCFEGLEKVVEQLGAEIKALEDARELGKALASGTPATAAGASGDGGKDGDDEPDWRLHGSLVRRFTLIERSETAWDAERGRLWRISHMRLSFGSRSAGMWLASKRRRTVDLDQVVFDPLRLADEKTHVNLFRGLEMKPAAGKCDRLLELLRYLCGEEEATFTPISDWVLKWAAYPLQHIGAKMRTAVVMYGPERTGKNMFWGELRKIYGRYGSIITQSELEDKHNTWMSAKLFIIANEVVTRAEMSHLVGKLKHMVTEEEIYINPKMVDQRYERNHVNMVFFSNEIQPLKIFPGDERYMVIRTPVKKAKEYYRELGAELKAGGAQALMQYLLELDLGDFNEYSVPLLTPGKESVIEVGLLPSQIFWNEIKAELLPLPYCPAFTEDVYRAYTVWCQRNGHKMPEALNRFTPNFMSMNGVRRIEPRVPDPDRPEELGLVDEEQMRKRRVFVMGEAAADPGDERQRVLRGVSQFRRALKAYLAEGSWRSDDSAPARSRYQEGVF